MKSLKNLAILIFIAIIIMLIIGYYTQTLEPIYLLKSTSLGFLSTTKMLCSVV